MNLMETDYLGMYNCIGMF